MYIKNKFLSLILIFSIFVSTFSFPIVLADNSIKVNNSIKIEFIKNRAIFNTKFDKKLVNKVNIQLDKIKFSLSKKQDKEKILSKINKNLELAISKTKNEKDLSILLYLKSYFAFHFIGMNISEIKKENNLINENISNEEIKKVNEEILNLQKNIFNSGVDFYESISKELEDLLNTKQTGTFESIINADINGFGKIDTKLNFNNIEAINSGLDTKVSGDMDFSGNFVNLLDENQNISGNINTFFDIIAKNENLYVLLKDFGINVDTNEEEIQKGVDDIKNVVGKLFENNKYAKIVDENSKEVIQLMNSIKPNIIINETEKYFSKPFFEVDRKLGDKYILKPTRNICDMYFELEGLMGKISPFYRPNTCNDLAFNSFKKSINEMGEFYIILGDNENILGFDINDKNNELNDKIIELKYDKNSINSINITLTPSDEELKGAGIWFEYIKNKNIDFKFFIEDTYDLFDIKFNSILDNENKIIKSDLDININDQILGNFKYQNNLLNGNIDFEINDDFNGNIEIKNNILNGKITLDTKTYDYQTYEYKKDGDIVFDITGKIKSNLEIENINLKAVGKNGEDQKYLDINSKIDFIGDRINFNNTFDITYPYLGNYNGKFDLEYESTKAKELFNFDLNINGAFGTVNGNIKSDFTKEYLKIEIKEPINFEEINEEKLEDILINETDLYSSEMKKAKDSVRINDVMAIRGALEQYYQDNWEYPDYKNFKDIKIYLSNFPVDPTEGKEIDGCEFGYKYVVGDDENGIKNNVYRLSTCFEDKLNIERKAKNDGGIDNLRLEVGIDLDRNYGEGYFIKELIK